MSNWRDPYNKRGLDIRNPTAATVLSVLVVAIIVILWFALGSSSKKVNPSAVAQTNTSSLIRNNIAQTIPQLIAYQRKVQHSIYWIGPFKGFTYQLTTTKNGDVYLRYLPQGVKANDPQSKWTIIGTYPGTNAYQAVQTNITKFKMHSLPVLYHGVSAWSDKHPNNVYVAYPGLPELIEIYDPTKGDAQKFADSSLLAPVQQ